MNENKTTKMITLTNEYRTAVVTLIKTSPLDISLQIVMNCEADTFTFEVEFNISKLIKVANSPYEQLFLNGFEYIFSPGICVDEFGDLRLCLKVAEIFDDSYDTADSFVILSDNNAMCELAAMMEDSETTIANSILSEHPTFTTYASYEEVDSFIPLIDLTYFIQCK